jgi:hypothetical protein
MAIDDQMLIRSVANAAAQCLDPERVESAVGEAAWINTRRARDRSALNTADIGPDDPARPLPPLREARDVVYWGRPVRSRNPRIVGIAWDAQGGCEIFFGVVYPP